MATWSRSSVTRWPRMGRRSVAIGLSNLLPIRSFVAGISMADFENKVATPCPSQKGASVLATHSLRVTRWHPLPFGRPCVDITARCDLISGGDRCGGDRCGGDSGGNPALWLWRCPNWRSPFTQLGQTTRRACFPPHGGSFFLAGMDNIYDFSSFDTLPHEPPYLLSFGLLSSNNVDRSKDLCLSTRRRQDRLGRRSVCSMGVPSHCSPASPRIWRIAPWRQVPSDDPCPWTRRYQGDGSRSHCLPLRRPWHCLRRL